MFPGARSQNHYGVGCLPSTDSLRTVRCHVILRRSWVGIGRADFKPEISTAALLSVCYRSEPPRRHPASSEGFDRNSTVTWISFLFLVKPLHYKLPWKHGWCCFHLCVDDANRFLHFWYFTIVNLAGVDELKARCDGAVGGVVSENHVSTCVWHVYIAVTKAANMGGIKHLSVISSLMSVASSFGLVSAASTHVS